jgi:hypothetical protein
MMMVSGHAIVSVAGLVRAVGAPAETTWNYRG